MLRTLFVLALALSAAVMRAQAPADMIVSTGGDTIRCTISTVRADRLYYTTIEGGRTRKARIPMDQVAVYKREGFFPVVPGRVVPSADAAVPPKERARVKHDWLFSASYGYSRRYAPLADNIPQDLRSYTERLRTGRHVSGSVHWFAMEHVAIGLMYNGSFGSRNSTTITVKQPDGTTIQGPVSNDIRVDWYGANVLFAPMGGKKVSPYASLGAGYITYQDKATYFEPYTVTGNTIGAELRAGVDLMVAPSLTIGAQFVWSTGRLKSFKIDTGDQSAEVDLMEPYAEGLGRIDLAVVLRLRL